MIDEQLGLTLTLENQSEKVTAVLTLDGQWECPNKELLSSLRANHKVKDWSSGKHPLRECLEHARWFYNHNGSTATAKLGVKLSIIEIIRLNKKISQFWASAHGWAPSDASNKLSQARLDRQYALSICLDEWTRDRYSHHSDGRLILAWVNLGSLVEGTLKWFLNVYDDNYSSDPVKKDKQAIEAGELMLGITRDYFKKHVWVDSERDHWDEWISKVQKRRNSIHAYSDHDIASFSEFDLDVEKYLELLEELNGRTPYPD